MKIHPTPFLTLLLALTMPLVGCACRTNRSEIKAFPNNHPIQEITDKAVTEAKNNLNPKGIAVIVAEPISGKILALSGEVVHNIFEPGSTFKPVVAVAALEKGVITPKTKIFCENGLFHHGGKVIKDHFASGDLSYDQILLKSSNIGASKMALMLKDEDFSKYVRKFGFGEKTGITLSGENPGLVLPSSQWDQLTKARMAFGQNVAVTPMQLTMAYCALANGGVLMRPAIRNENSKIVRRVCSQKTADMVKNALSKVASDEGTAPLARVEGITGGGKTGTAQAMSKNGRYLADQYWTMFAGFFPIDHPKYVIVVVVDEADLPSEKNYGGLVAAPIFAEVATKISALNRPASALPPGSVPARR